MSRRADVWTVLRSDAPQSSVCTKDMRTQKGPARFHGVPHRLRYRCLTEITRPSALFQSRDKPYTSDTVCGKVYVLSAWESVRSTRESADALAGRLADHGRLHRFPFKKRCAIALLVSLVFGRFQRLRGGPSVVLFCELGTMPGDAVGYWRHLRRKPLQSTDCAAFAAGGKKTETSPLAFLQGDTRLMASRRFLSRVW